MKTLVLGASGATGRKLVDHLLHMGHEVKVIVRSLEKLPGEWQTNEHLTVVEKAVLDMSVEEMMHHVSQCSAVAFCLGHNMSFQGIFGSPRKLVADAVRLVCEAIAMSMPRPAVKLVLMNTAGNHNREFDKPISAKERLSVKIIRTLLPPHRDNEDAAAYLSSVIGKNNAFVEWVVVRPDSLIDEAVSAYEVFASPTRSAIFNPGKTSRSNVAHFMASLLTKKDLWECWRGQMPVVYNK